MVPKPCSLKYPYPVNLTPRANFHESRLFTTDFTFPHWSDQIRFDSFFLIFELLQVILACNYC